MEARSLPQSQAGRSNLASLCRRVFCRGNRANYANQSRVRESVAAPGSNQFIQSLVCPAPRPKCKFKGNHEGVIMIVCWLYRRIISSRLDDRRSLSTWVQRHTHTCSRCLQFQHTTESIAKELQTTAESQRVQRPFLHGKIMRAVGAESAAPRPA